MSNQGQGSLRQRRKSINTESLNKAKSALSNNSMTLGSIADMIELDTDLSGIDFKSAVGSFGGEFSMNKPQSNPAPTRRSGSSSLRSGTFDYSSFVDDLNKAQPPVASEPLMNARLYGKKLKHWLVVSVSTGLILGVPIGQAISATTVFQMTFSDEQAAVLNPPAIEGQFAQPGRPAVDSHNQAQCKTLKMAADNFDGEAAFAAFKKWKEFGCRA